MSNLQMHNDDTHTHKVFCHIRPRGFTKTFVTETASFYAKKRFSQEILSSFEKFIFRNERRKFSFLSILNEKTEMMEFLCVLCEKTWNFPFMAKQCCMCHATCCTTLTIFLFSFQSLYCATSTFHVTATTTKTYPHITQQKINDFCCVIFYEL